MTTQPIPIASPPPAPAPIETAMNLHEASHLARSLMQQHGLTTWTFQFDHARRRFGRCDYTHRRITLSKSLTFLNPIEEVRDTILHEIAHALTPGANHGPRWRSKCLEIGARPNRCFTEAHVISPPRPPARYLFGCPRCNWWVHRRRTQRRKFQCAKCSGKVVFMDAPSQSRQQLTLKRDCNAQHSTLNTQRSTFNCQQSRSPARSSLSTLSVER
jgi:predicted SprT family Zn-dependent metalloprotease